MHSYRAPNSVLQAFRIWHLPGLACQPLNRSLKRKVKVPVIFVGATNTPDAKNVLSFAGDDEVVLRQSLGEPKELVCYAGCCCRSVRITAKKPLAYLLPYRGLADNPWEVRELPVGNLSQQSRSHALQATRFHRCRRELCPHASSDGTDFAGARPR
jgi:hypothetical protein